MHSSWTLLLSVAVSLRFALAITGGVEQDWDRNTYLVKVTAWLKEGSDEAFSCFGTLITPHVVLTTPDCVTNENKALEDIQVAIRIRKKRQSGISWVFTVETFLANVANWTEDWALLNVDGPDVKSLCPSGASPKGIAQLNVRPSLRQRSVVGLTAESIYHRECYLLGFDCYKADNLVDKGTIRKLKIDKLEESEYGLPYLKKSLLNTASNHDIGSPLICNDDELGFVQVGFLKAAKSETSQEDNSTKDAGNNEVKLAVHDVDGKSVQKGIKEGQAKQNDKSRSRRDTSDDCREPKDLYFQVTSDDEALFEAIEMLDMPGLAAVYHQCNFRAFKYSIN